MRLNRAIQLAVPLLTALIVAPTSTWGMSMEPAGGEDPAPLTRAVALRSGSFTPAPGVAAALRQLVAERLHGGKPYLHVIAQRNTFPDPDAWEIWALHGVHRAAYLGDRTWIVRVDLDIRGGQDAEEFLEGVRRRIGATALREIRPEDKTSPELAGPSLAVKSERRSPGSRSVLVMFFPEMPPGPVLALISHLHVGPEPPEELGSGIWVLRIRHVHLRRLLSAEEVQFVEAGPVPELPLMDRTRLETGAEAVQGILPSWTPPQFLGYTGIGVRVSNSEGLFAEHDDFWNHDVGGARTTPRWLGCEAGSFHGAMTAGIILGNGWQSASRGGAPYAWRGIAPSALLDCYDHEPDVSNHSFTQGFGGYNTMSALTDRRIRGDASSNFHPAVGAVANQGITAQYGTERGYYSVYRHAKNEIIVGNVSATGFDWNGSSLGPTWDGRIKPDIVAPGSRSQFSRDRERIVVDLDYLEVVGPGRIERWTFDTVGDSWSGGWGEDPWWGRRNVEPVTQLREGLTTALRVGLKPPPWGGGFDNRPVLGTLTGADSQTRLGLDGMPGDRVRIRYRVDGGADWTQMFVRFTWASDPLRYQHRELGFELLADGRWHVVTLDVGADQRWASDTGIDYLNLRFSGPEMPVPGAANGYGGAGGSSAAAPVVTGAIALLLEQMVDRFGVRLGDHSPSPFEYRERGEGVPLPSTWKALLIHTARDLAAPLRLWEPPNPDTGAHTTYHDGPDLATGYGLIDVAEASRLLEAEAEAQRSGGATEPHFIAEADLDPLPYTIEVEENRNRPLKVTLAWDDPSAAPNSSQTTPKLVNDLDLLVIGPDDRFYYPWSIDLPYEPTTAAESPEKVEPEPITPEDIRPARRDRQNHRDNVEQVVVEFPLAGRWRVYVLASGLGAPPQKYSIVLDSPPPPPSERLSGGRVAFVSDRVDPPQIFVQEVGSSAPPKQVSFGHYAAAHPVWSHDGRYLAYVTEDVIVGPMPGTVDVVEIVTADGKKAGSLEAGRWFQTTRARYPGWSSDGRKLVLTTFDEWGERGLTVVELGAPYDFSPERARAYTVVPHGVAPDALDPADAEFSPDGRYIYFGASSNEVEAGLYRIPSSGGEPYRIYGNGTPIRRAFAVSVSPDGNRLLYNSELWREDPERYLDEELFELDLRTGLSVRLTDKAGHQYGWYAQGGSGEFVMQSSTTAGGPFDIYLVDAEDEVRLDPGGTGDSFNDNSLTWWKP